MTREDFKNHLEYYKVKYIEVKPRDDWDFYQIYVEDKRVREFKDSLPKTRSDVYVPYIRVSHFDGSEKYGMETRNGFLYIRENGYTYWMKVSDVIKKCEEYGT